MLTKEHLRIKVRGGVAKIDFLEAAEEHLGRADDVLAFLQQHQDSTLAEIDREFSSQFKKDKIAPGLMKLALDKSGLGEAVDVSSRRLDWLLRAQALRSECGDDYQIFQEKLAQQLESSFPEIANNLYGDLPQYRVLQKVAPVDAEWLVDRYNLAQVQGLLLQSSKLTVTIEQPGQDGIRLLLRQARFHRLLVEVKQVDSGIQLEFAGPTAVLTNAANHGVRLANFFPNILCLAGTWTVQAELLYKKKQRKFTLQSSSGLRGDKGKMRPVIPEDLAKFVTAFRDLQSDYTVELGEEVFQVGDQHCFPDLIFCSPTGQKWHLEIFYKGQNSQFIRRVEEANRCQAKEYFVAVAQPLVSRAETAARLEKVPWFQKFGLTYRSFPVTKQVLEFLQGS